MKRTLLALFFITLGWTSFAQKAVTPTTVMSFNIRYNNPGDGEHNWQNRRERVLQKMNLDFVDIVGFQEVLADQLDYLDSTMVDYDWVGVGRDDGKRAGEFSPIFYKKDIFTSHASGTTWLSPTPDTPSIGWDAACIRIATWAVLERKETGEKLLMINTHFDHVGKTAREESSKVIVALADSLKSVYKDLPQVLLGDFNTVERDPSLSPITGTFRHARGYCVDAPTPTFIGFPSDVTKEGKNPAELAIDHIFIRGVKASDYTVDTQNYGLGFLSDHLSVTCTLN